MNNAACIGYAILAAKKAGFTQEQIQSLVNKIRDLHETKSEDEAEQTYRKSPY